MKTIQKTCITCSNTFMAIMFNTKRIFIDHAKQEWEYNIIEEIDEANYTKPEEAA